MTTLQITLDERAAAAICDTARLAGKTPEVWVAEVAVRQAVTAHDNEWIDEFLRRSGNSRGDSKGWKWNREELYER
jgi:hypothetical protein